MERIRLRNIVKIGSYEQVENLPLSSITGDKVDVQVLNGIILKGYEMRWDERNFNGERYERNAFAKFINDYYVGRGLNLPLTLMHGERFEDIAGRVLIMDERDDGVYYVAYVSASVPQYEHIKAMLAEGLLQGFSKEGWVVDYSVEKAKDGQQVLVVKEMQMTAMSLVTTPANALGFEDVAEIRNALKYERREQKKSIYKH